MRAISAVPWRGTTISPTAGPGKIRDISKSTNFIRVYRYPSWRYQSAVRRSPSSIPTFGS